MSVKRRMIRPAWLQRGLCGALSPVSGEWLVLTERKLRFLCISVLACVFQGPFLGCSQEFAETTVRGFTQTFGRAFGESLGTSLGDVSNLSGLDLSALGL